MRKSIVAANWKMNGSQTFTIAYIEQLLGLLNCEKRSLPELIIFPPVIYLNICADMLERSGCAWGSQNVYPQAAGALTGEISGPMLKEYGCKYVLVGHSERRLLFKEDEIFVAKKFHHVKEHDMIPILCVGETLEEHQQGKTLDVLYQQLMAVWDNHSQNCFANCIIAYEPVWAIGTGQSASTEWAQQIHAAIRQFVAEINREHAENLPIIYGGSVTEKNAQALFAQPDIDGGLVGGASLNALQFADIVKCTNSF